MQLVVDCDVCHHVCVQPHDEDQVVTMQFSWGGDLKPISTSFIGVSPEVRFSRVKYVSSVRQRIGASLAQAT